MRRATLFTLALIVLTTTARPVTAQQSGFYVGGSLTRSPWVVADAWGGTAATSWKNTTTDTRTRGLNIEIGGRLGQSCTAGFEATFPLDSATISQHYGYGGGGGPYKAEVRYRESTLFLVFRGIVTAPRLQIGVVGGGGVVSATARERFSYGNPQTGIYGAFGAEKAEDAMQLAGTGGLDVAVAVAPHVSIVPQFRIVAIRRPDAYGGETPFRTFGVSRFLYRVGVGLRATF